MVARRNSVELSRKALRLERLEDRFALSGFAGIDGSYVEDSNVIGEYSAVRIQASDGKIVVAGGVAGGTGLGLARFDALGNVDTTYGNGGWISPPAGGSSLALQSDGKAVTASAPEICGGNSCASIAVARVDTAGSLDSSFGSGGSSSVIIASAPSSQVASAGAIGLQSTGEIVVGGSAGSSSALARFTASGTVDNTTLTSFGSSCQKVRGKQVCSSYWSEYTNLAIQPDDKIVAVGIVNTTGSNYQAVVARYTAAGVLDTSFNGNGFSIIGAAVGDTEAWGEALQSDGKIVVSGGSWVNGVHHMIVWRYNPNGTLDTNFTDGVHRGYIYHDIGGVETAHSVAIQPDGKITTAGSYTANGQQPYSIIVDRFNPNGSVDSTFGTGGYKVGSAVPGTGFHDLRADGVALETDGSIIVAGVDYWGTTGSTEHPMLMRFNGTSGVSGAQSTNSTSTADATDAALMLMLTDTSSTTTKRK